MADYSGYWSCPSCPAYGSGYGIDREHDANCPTHLKHVAWANEKRIKIQAAQLAHDAELEMYTEMNEDTLFQLLWETQLRAGDLYEEYRQEKDRADIMLESLRWRPDKATNRWLDYSRAKGDELRATMASASGSDNATAG